MPESRKPSLFVRIMLTLRSFHNKKQRMFLGEDATINPDLLREIHGDKKPKQKK